MKKNIWLVLLTVVCVLLFSLPVAGVAFADDNVTVTYVYGDNESVTSMAKGTVLDSPPSYSFLSGLGIDAKDLSGKRIVTRFGSDEGEDVVYPYAVTENTTIYVVLLPSEETVTYTYVYDYVTPERYKSVTASFAIGSVVTHKGIVNNTAVRDYYADPALRNKVLPAVLAEKDETYYVSLNKTVSFRLNGNDYTADYGASIRDVTKTGSHEVLTFYLDEEKTQPYATGIAIDGIKLYGDFVRTHYAVTFQN